MSLLRGMKIYTVHIPANDQNAQEKAVFLREGFNWMAFLFTGLWALYHRLWLLVLYIVLFNVALMSLEQEAIISSSGAITIQLGFQVLVGFHANDWLRAKLAKRGYIMADISAADSLLRAEQRYFERLYHPAH